ncbi:MAG: hypothetical protein ED556_04120 [Winogradskyella sp.]|nr:MAG: hypothetical protein ED556_04120 [Winogradskyella sp.]
MVCVLSNAGDQVPVKPSFDVVGNGANASPEQIGNTASNVGIILGFTVTVKVSVNAHSPGFGVNV